jgi:hypothetical protein
MTLALVALTVTLAAQGAAPVAPTASDGATPGVSTYVDLEGGLGYSTNPNLTLGNGSGRALMRASAQAVRTRYSARSTTRLSAFGENVTYFGRYGSQQLVQLSAHHDTAVDEKIRVFGDLSASLDRSGQLGTRLLSVGPVVAPLTPTLILPTLPEPQDGFVTADGRTYRLGGQLGARLSMSAVDSVTASIGTDRVLLRGTAFDTSYSLYRASVAYERSLSARTTIGQVVSLQTTDYEGPASVTVITPQVTARLALSDRTDLSGAVGLSFAKVKDQIVTERSTGLATNASLCRRGESDQLCATIGRDQQTATTAGPVTVLSAGVSYFKRLDAKQTFQLSANGNRYSNRLSDLPSEIVEGSSYVTSAAAYTRQLGARLYGGTNLSARRLFREGLDPKADVSGSMFLRLSLGDRR